MFKTSFAAMFVALLPSLGFSQACSGAAMTTLEQFFREDQIALFNIQLQRNAIAGREVMVPDGLWGPASEAVICDALTTYAAINGIGGDELVQNAEDAAQFARWMGAMARVSLNPGRFEAPD